MQIVTSNIIEPMLHVVMDQPHTFPTTYHLQDIREIMTECTHICLHASI